MLIILMSSSCLAMSEVVEFARIADLACTCLYDVQCEDDFDRCHDWFMTPGKNTTWQYPCHHCHPERSLDQKACARCVRTKRKLPYSKGHSQIDRCAAIWILYQAVTQRTTGLRWLERGNASRPLVGAALLDASPKVGRNRRRCCCIFASSGKGSSIWDFRQHHASFAPRFSWTCAILESFIYFSGTCEWFLAERCWFYVSGLETWRTRHRWWPSCFTHAISLWSWTIKERGKSPRPLRWWLQSNTFAEFMAEGLWPRFGSYPGWWLGRL